MEFRLSSLATSFSKGTNQRTHNTLRFFSIQPFKACSLFLHLQTVSVVKTLHWIAPYKFIKLKWHPSTLQNKKLHSVHLLNVSWWHTVFIQWLYTTCQVLGIKGFKRLLWESFPKYWFLTHGSQGRLNIHEWQLSIGDSESTLVYCNSTVTSNGDIGNAQPLLNALTKYHTGTKVSNSGRKRELATATRNEGAFNKSLKTHCVVSVCT